MRLISIFALLICLIMFMAPSLVQQTAMGAGESISGPTTSGTGAGESISGSTTSGTGAGESISGLTLEGQRLQRCTDLEQQMSKLKAEQAQLQAQPESEQRTTNLDSVKNQINHCNVQLIANGCQKGTIPELTGSNPASQPSSPPATGTTTTGTNQQTSDRWSGTWSHDAGTLTLKLSSNALNFLNEPTSMFKGPRITYYTYGKATYVGVLTWSKTPYGSVPLKAAVFAFADGNKLIGRFTTESGAFESVLPQDEYNSESQKINEQNVNNGVDRIGWFEVELYSNDPNWFEGILHQVQIDPDPKYANYNDPPFQEISQFPFKAQRTTSSETNPSSNSNTGNSNGATTGGGSDM